MKAKDERIKGISSWLIHLDMLYRTRYDYPSRYNILVTAQEKISVGIYAFISGFFFYGLLIVLFCMPMIRKYRRLQSTSKVMNIILIGLIIGVIFLNIIVFQFLTSEKTIEKTFLQYKARGWAVIKTVLEVQAFIYENKTTLIIYELAIISLILSGYLIKNIKAPALS